MPSTPIFSTPKEAVTLAKRARAYGIICLLEADDKRRRKDVPGPGWIDFLGRTRWNFGFDNRAVLLALEKGAAVSIFSQHDQRHFLEKRVQTF